MFRHELGTDAPTTSRAVIPLPLLTALSLCLLAAACGSGGTGSAQSSGSAQSAGSAQSSGTQPAEKYALLMATYAAESGNAIDPMMFVSAPGSPAGVGALNITHVAGVTPAKQADAPTTTLLGAGGAPLGITLGHWQQAAGTVSFSCVGAKERASSTLTGLLPSATYSTFVVHTALDGPGRFTPWGDAAGTTNNFTASGTGSASPSSTVQGCLGSSDDIIIIWHSDGRTHGSSPGTIGVNWHTSLIAPTP